MGTDIGRYRVGRHSSLAAPVANSHNGGSATGQLNDRGRDGLRRVDAAAPVCVVQSALFGEGLVPSVPSCRLT